MVPNSLKYIFYSVAFLLLALMLKGASDAGISGDEYLHYDQSVYVYNYFSTLGKDTAALNTPHTHLKYYGQSFDNLTTILIRWFNIEDVFLFRHLSCAISGWLTIMITAFFAIWLSGYGTGITVMLLFALSPTFMGHAQNNLKDIPFALGYIASLYFLFRYLFSQIKIKKRDLILLTLSIAFSISIRPGGLLLICYLFFFLLIYLVIQYFKQFPKFNLFQFIASFFQKKLLQAVLISASAWLLSIILWPFAQLNPIKNVWKSYEVMTQFPTTIQQIFEGKFEWSDLMPWYYLPEYMAITIPLAIFAGIVLFLVYARKLLNGDDLLKYFFLIFSVMFPVVFVIYEKSNLYGSWRHFLFVYPSIILLAATGFSHLFSYLQNRYLILIMGLFIILLSFDPINFMVKNYPYYYLYYNQLVGGLKGACGKYETDYYYHTIREGSAWLTDYLKNNKQEKPVKIAGNFPLGWYFRNQAGIKTFYVQYDERSEKDWDYMIVVNSYIPVKQLINKEWPTSEAIHTIYVDSVPVCTVLKRTTKDDFWGYQSFSIGDIPEAKRFFENALKINTQDELIFYNFAATFVKEGKPDSAVVYLQKAVKINPGYEPVLMLLGNIAVKQNKVEEAIRYYETLLGYNRKYFDAYVAWAKLLKDRDVVKARELLKTCLKLSPGYKSAIRVLADSYRESDPEVAKRYDRLLNSK